MRSKTNRLRMCYLLHGELMNLVVDESNPCKARCLRKHFLLSNKDKRSEGKINAKAKQTTKVQKLELWSLRLRGQLRTPCLCLSGAFSSSCPDREDNVATRALEFDMCQIRHGQHRQTHLPRVLTSCRVCTADWIITVSYKLFSRALLLCPCTCWTQQCVMVFSGHHNKIQ